MKSELSLLWRNLCNITQGGILWRVYVICVYLKASIAVSLHLLRSYGQRKGYFPLPPSPTVAALASIGMTHVTEEVLTGGYSCLTKRVYVERSEGDNKKGSGYEESLEHARASLLVYCLWKLRTCLFGKWDGLQGSGLIVIEDIKGEALVMDDTLTHVKRRLLIKEAMKNAARIHARYHWNRCFASTLWNDAKKAISKKASSDSWIDYLRSCPELMKFIDQFIEGSTWDAYEKFKKTFRHPLTLIHGDYRLSNQLWVEEENKLYTVDWAEASVGDGPADIAFYFFNYPHISERRQWEDEMVRIYWEELGEQGVDLSSYPLSMCREAYVRSGIDRGIQMVIGLVYCGVRKMSSLDDKFIEHLVEQVDAFVGDHKDEYEGPHILMSGRWAS
ncbi:hypothetical protein FOL47_001795 [Perkinsus chesapeaki]|uniref:Aminoglycoside phosphotransferase domain-containing protein n=1 Tax=Perkinsus chesapeaki TaxID=330153 RepID=A0A7J6MI14_PERCH|nr:hypothetical protein FOL47_001795 [Perkinsus chesapeaki]